jgi:hypothetical protein
MMLQRVEQIRRKNESAMVPCNFKDGDQNDEAIRRDAANLAMMTTNKVDQCPTLIFNEANVSVEERSRLYVRRLGYCSSKLLQRMTEDPDLGNLPKLVQLNEDSPVNDGAKFKKRTHSRTPRDISMGRPCWFRVYADGYAAEIAWVVRATRGLLEGTFSSAPQQEICTINSMLLMSNSVRLFFSF